MTFIALPDEQAGPIGPESKGVTGMFPGLEEFMAAVMEAAAFLVSLGAPAELVEEAMSVLEIVPFEEVPTPE